jgi:predicted transcriptional regulator
MKKNNTYKSLKFKSFKEAMISDLEKNFGLLGSGKVLDLMSENILELIQQYMPERIETGKIVFTAIAKDAPKGHHRGVKGLPKTPVKLDILNKEIIARYESNESVRKIKRDHVINLFKQAYEQGGVLSSMDIAAIQKMSAATVSKYVREHMEKSNEIIPTRGFIHDIGPSISHKGIIVGKFLQGMLPDKVAKTTNHSQMAVDRYIKDYERVKICIKQKMEKNETSRATGLSKNLVTKYEEMYNQYEGGKK